MNPDLGALTRQLASLSERFAALGAKLSEAARELQDAGAPPADALVEELATAHGEFADLRADVLAAAEALEVAAPEHLESLNSLEPILAALAGAAQTQGRRTALEQARNAVLGVLEQVLAVTHSDDPAFAPLVGCQGKARELRDAVRALTDAQSDEARSLTDEIRAFADFLTMLQGSAALDDDHFAQLEENVSRTFGRPLAVAAARGRLMLAGSVPATPRPAPSPPPPPPAPEPPPEIIRKPAEPKPEPVRFARQVEPAPERVREPSPPRIVEPAPTREEPAHVSASASAEASGPDETAQWWLAAWARWAGWKNNLDFGAAVREELGKYPYLLSVPIQKSPEYEDGLLAYGYSLLLEHAEKQNPGCVGNALNSLKPSHVKPVGQQLYEYLVAEGRLAQTYAEFVKTVLLSAIPEPGVWFQNRILESKDDTRILQRPTPRIGESEQTGQRLATDGQRFTEHRFKTTLAPLTTRFFLASSDIKEARGVDIRLTANDTPSDTAWLLTIPAPGKAKTQIEERRLTEGGMALPGLGKDYSTLWIAVFNDDPVREKSYELGITLKKDAKSPFGGKARAAAS